MFKLVLMDLDETLLRSDKTISDYTQNILHKCREQGILIGFITARGEYNALTFIDQIRPDIVISSGGAQIRYRGEVIFSWPLSVEDTDTLIRVAQREDENCMIAVDGLEKRYWNAKERKKGADWGEIYYTDFSDFHECALRLSIQLESAEAAERIAASIDSCDWVNFLGGKWYKFSRVEATKENAAAELIAYLGLDPAEAIAFGDDFGDMGMLRFCGRGVAMGNAMDTVKAVADAIGEDNDHDGVARYLAEHVLSADHN